jgi:hypothetical protein
VIHVLRCPPVLPCCCLSVLLPPIGNNCRRFCTVISDRREYLTFLTIPVGMPLAFCNSYLTNKRENILIWLNCST